ncbi:MAG: MoaD/ThiS family protein [Lentisphaerae bacterium]|nr:MoaD/ThiS family protein [Lentisphaerota bacterium]MBT4816393.1 MoaD/ThiS family protein [Lentisphaerota bacterium]MBT5606840.1 MoaD/ThiS family protein [Lentisphaerota bacterium]MBT7055302.1 MoaD/ThiS family protein [Lentisphaerota bacterium]MBT7843083.1 MoaD/ThiS family protein [Lentisphaerota bacterium]
MPDEPRLISVTVSLRATLAKYRPVPACREPFSVSLSVGATVADLADTCNIPAPFHGLVTVNGSQATPDTVLDDGVAVDMFPPLGGG